MRKCKKFKKIICTVLAAALTAAMPAGIFAEDMQCGASVTFGKTIIENGAQAITSTTPPDDNYALIGEKEGHECVITQVKRHTDTNKNECIADIPILVDDTYIDSDDRNIAVKLTYFDHDWDTIHITYKTAGGATYKHDIVKYATNTWRTAAIVLRNPSLNGTLAHGADLLISAAEDTLIRETEYISKIEIINLDKSYNIPNAETKADILHITEARVLSDIGLFDGFTLNSEKNGLEKALTLEEAAKAVIRLCYENTDELKNAVCSATDVSDGAKPYIGLAIDKGFVSLNSDATIGASRIVTMEELLKLFVFAVKGKETTAPLSDALSLKLVKKLTSKDEHGITGSGIVNVVPGMWSVETDDLSRNAYLDDLAAISYSMMSLTPNGGNKKTMAALFGRDVFSREAIAASGCGELIYEFYRQTGFNIVEDSYVDSDTGVTINTLSLPGLPSSGGYSHSMNMSSDGKKIIIGAGIDTSSNYCTLVVYDRETKKAVPLNPELKESYYYGYIVAPNVNKVYYNCARELYEFDLETMTNRYITEQGSEESLWCGVPSVSDDGELFVQYKYYRDGDSATADAPLNFDIINTKTGKTITPFTESETMELKSPRGNYTVKSIGHVTVNPVYKNLFSYVLEYEEGSSPKELWLYDSDTDTHKCIYSDHVTNNATDVSTAHWVWSEDGEKSYFIKYSSSDYVDTLPGVGMVWVDNDGNSDYSIEGYLNGDYSYNHVGVSPNDRYFAGDNTSRWNGERFESKVVLIDGQTGKSRLLANKIGIWVNHPGHVHPLISEDCSTLSFTMAGDNHQLMVGYIDLNTLPEINEKEFEVAFASFGNSGMEKGIELYHEYDDRAWYSDIDVQTREMGGKTCLEISPKHRAPFEVSAQYITYDKNTVTFKIKYFDNGRTPIELLYNSTYLGGTSTERNRHVYSFDRENTNEWKTKEITLTDVCFCNSAPGTSDFSIKAPSSSDAVYIKEIYIAAGDSIPDGASVMEENGVVFANAQYYKGENLIESPIGQTGNVTVTVNAGNTEKRVMCATLIVAVFNKKSGAVTDVKSTGGDIQPSDILKLSQTVNIPDTDHEIRYFLWKDMKSIVPFELTAHDYVPPKPPARVLVHDVTDTAAVLSWRGASDNKGIYGYEIYRSDSEKPIALIKDTSYTDASLTHNTQYSYFIKTVDICGQRSQASEKVHITTER